MEIYDVGREEGGGEGSREEQKDAHCVGEEKKEWISASARGISSRMKHKLRRNEFLSEALRDASTATDALNRTRLSLNNQPRQTLFEYFAVQT